MSDQGTKQAKRHNASPKVDLLPRQKKTETKRIITTTPSATSSTQQPPYVNYFSRMRPKRVEKASD